MAKSRQEALDFVRAQWGGNDFCTPDPAYVSTDFDIPKYCTIAGIEQQIDAEEGPIVIVLYFSPFHQLWSRIEVDKSLVDGP